jgi:acetyl esterase/lipase
MPDIANDPRLDPRIRAFLLQAPVSMTSNPSATSREQLLAIVNSESARAQGMVMAQALDALDIQSVTPDEGLSISTHTLTSHPDGNTLNLQFIRPDNDQTVPCVYYIHGGGMASLSCFLGNYRAWGKMIAHQGVAVAMIDFRNSLTPSSVPEISAFPGGLNDCVSGLRWISEHAEQLNIDATRIVISGESGGGNLTLATAMQLVRDGDIDRVKGLYALCPYVAGIWPDERYPSSTENNGILIGVSSDWGRLSYGPDAWDRRDPLAWPGFATEDDVKGLPPTVISVNECDPLRDEGVAFYRLLNRAGVQARCRMLMGTCHAIEIFPPVAPEISISTAREIADLCRA